MLLVLLVLVRPSAAIPHVGVPPRCLLAGGVRDLPFR